MWIHKSHFYGYFYKKACCSLTSFCEWQLLPICGQYSQVDSEWACLKSVTYRLGIYTSKIKCPAVHLLLSFGLPTLWLLLKTVLSSKSCLLPVRKPQPHLTWHVWEEPIVLVDEPGIEAESNICDRIGIVLPAVTLAYDCKEAFNWWFIKTEYLSCACLKSEMVQLGNKVYVILWLFEQGLHRRGL